MHLRQGLTRLIVSDGEMGIHFDGLLTLLQRFAVAVSDAQCPEVPFVRHLDQLGRDPNAIARTADARLWLLLAHVHDARHERVHGADVAKVPFTRKRMLERVIGIQTF